MTRTGLLFSLGIVAGLAGALALGVPGMAEEEPPPPPAAAMLGGFGSHITEERIDVSVGVGRGGDFNSPKRFAEPRYTVVVPEHFGRLHSVAAEGTTTVLWYEDEAGVLRNVVIPDAARRSYRVERNGSVLVAEIRRPL